MATIYDISKPEYVKKDLDKLNMVWEVHSGLMALTVGNYPLENWIGLEPELLIHLISLNKELIGNLIN